MNALGDDSIAISGPTMSSKRLSNLGHSQPHSSDHLDATIPNITMTDHWTSFTAVIRASIAPMITDVTPLMRYSGTSRCHLPYSPLVLPGVVNSQIKSRGHDFVSGIEVE